jgi:hypothetical protein
LPNGQAIDRPIDRPFTKLMVCLVTQSPMETHGVW